MADARVHESHIAVLSGTPDTMRVHESHIAVLSGTPDTMRVHASHISVLVPVNRKPRRPGVIITDG